MRHPEPEPEIADEVPWSDRVSAYDEAHFVTYLRLLDANGDGASEEEMAWSVLRIDPAYEPDRAQRAVRSHLRRAQWLTKTGYRDLFDR